MRSLFMICAVISAWTSSTLADSREPGAVRLLALSGNLFDTAIKMNDPLLAIAAAKLRKQVGVKPGNMVPDGGIAAPVEMVGWEEFLAAAADMAAGDPSMVGLIEDVAAESSRGRLESPAQVGGEIATGEKLIYRNVTFRGGDYAEVYVEG